ncbi:MAG: hypothetical protein LBM59_00060 [Ruminococcus sp.]|jgi:hypothetical protein|nr:hypothetical protein [Ruminococcus sp.]
MENEKTVTANVDETETEPLREIPEETLDKISAGLDNAGVWASSLTHKQY